MRANVKTFSFFLLIAVLCAVPYLHGGIKKAVPLIQNEGENARELYTGKTRAVYNPLDTAYVVTDKLKELALKEIEQNYSGNSEWTVMSVWIDPKDLYDDSRGILSNAIKTGRIWERASHITFYEKGEKKFSSYAGIRVHGGSSRLSSKRPTFRFNFRKSIGEDSFTAKGITLTEYTPVKRLLTRKGDYLKTDFSYSLTKRMGGIAPNIRPVKVFINGEFYSHMHLTEHLHKDQVKHYFGHENFLFYKLKSSNDTRDYLRYENAIHRVKGQSKPISFEKMNKDFDLDNFTAHMLTVAYFGMHDWAQGVWVRDLDETGRWKIIAWDFDDAFSPAIDFSKKFEGPVWAKDGFYSPLNHYNASLKTILFKRLLTESPEYRKFFLQKVEKLFQEDLSDEFLREKFRYYEKLSAEENNPPEMISSIQLMKDFVKNRKFFFCQQVGNLLTETPATCSMLESLEGNMAGK